MESNRDEAERCIQIAAQALRDFEIEKAKKFLKKAEKLYPSQKAKGDIILSIIILIDHRLHCSDELNDLDLLEKVLASAKDSKNETESTSINNGSTKRRKSAASPSRKHQTTEPEFTSEQLQHVERIQRFYQLFLI